MTTPFLLEKTPAVVEFDGEPDDAILPLSAPNPLPFVGSGIHWQPLFYCGLLHKIDPFMHRHRSQRANSLQLFDDKGPAVQLSKSTTSQLVIPIFHETSSLLGNDLGSRRLILVGGP